MTSKPIVRNILAILVGGAVGGVLILAIESINVFLFPPPVDLDFEDRQAMEAYVDTLPATALLVVLAAYAIGSFGSAWTAAKVARSHHMLLALILGGMFQVGGIVNFIDIPTPTWMWIAGFLVFLPPAWLGGKIGTPTDEPKAE